MHRRRPRVAIAVEPTILGDALADVLEGAGVDEVVNLFDAPDEGGSFDAAVVTIVLPEAIDADVVIVLPDTPTGRGDSRVQVHGRTEDVVLGDVGDILRLLDDHCPADQPRHPPPPGF